MHAKFIAALALLAAATTHADILGTFQAFTSNTCDESMGVGGKEDIEEHAYKCIGTEGRHAFIMTYDEKLYKAEMEAVDTAGCDEEGEWTMIPSSQIRSGACVAVSTGENWMSAAASIQNK